MSNKNNKYYYKNHSKKNANYSNYHHKPYYKKNKNNINEEKKENILLVNNNLENENNTPFEFEPIKKQENLEIENNLEKQDFQNNHDIKVRTKRPIIKMAVGIFILIAIVLGTTYAFFNYYQEDTRQADITSGEVYVRVPENTVNITVYKYPMTDVEARARNDNYIDFTVNAKNTSLTKELYYTLTLNNGADVANKTRISRDYIKLDLQEKNGNSYTYVQEAVSLSDFDFEGIVPVNTTSEITKEYRLRLWVSDSVLISDTEPGATYTQSQFANLYANFHIEASSEDRVPPPTGEDSVRAAILAKQNAETNSCNPVYIDDNGTANDESDDITYFSGTNTCVDMNYVWYSGKLWRITAIYPDGAMKLVTENNITSIAFNASGQVNFYTDTNTTSYMYQWLNEDFYDTLYNASNIIDTTKRWNATMPENTTISTKPAETNMVTANVGLLNNYEYYNSYRCISSATCTGTSYSTGYLNIGCYWWLLNPYSTSGVWNVRSNGNGDYFNPATQYGARPSIYLKSGVKFTGNGTSDNPYKIVGDKTVGKANNLINKRLSGEYVKLKNGNSEQLFRIIGVEDNKTKIIAMDYADNKATKKFALGNTSGDGTIYGTGQTATQGEDTWYNYLTGTYEPNLETIYGPLFDSSTYYMGQVESGQSYKLGICSSSSGLIKNCTQTSQVGIFNIGLPRYGEMFATQQSGGYSNSIAMWLINRYSSSLVWVVSNRGSGSNNNPSATNGARPTLHLKSTVKILSGSGTEQDPYVVGLPS